MNCICSTCNKVYKNKKQLSKHEKNVHKIPKGAITCGFEKCKRKFHSINDYRNHIESSHKQAVEKETITFETREAFNDWLKEEEKRTNAHFVKCRGEINNNEYSVIDFKCNRSGKFESKAIGKRQLKVQGTAKIGFHCSAGIRLKVYPSIVKVDYCKTHVGHYCEPQHLPIPKEFKLNIADKLLSGFSEKEILHDVRLSAAQAVRREHLFSRKDLHNLKQNIGIQSTSKELRNSYDKVKDTSWMHQTKELENYPVIFLKEPFEKCDLLNEEDFCVVLMADYQSLMLKKFGFELICVGIAYDINGCEFHLVTILIIDEYEEQMPVAFCVTSVVNINLLIIFFQAVKEKVGDIKSKIFMGDDPICYSAWKQTFDVCQFPLLCMWHVLKNWREHVHDVNKGKQEMVFQALKDLIYQLNEQTFQKMLLELLDLLKKDKDTQEFEKYFTLNYGNCAAMWAYCYRKDLKISSNMCVETFHKAFKNTYLNSRKIPIVKCIEKLVDLIADKQFDHLIKSYKGKLSKKTTSSYMRHKESVTCDYIFNEINENTWEIHSSESMYIINKNHSCDDNCIIACRLCYCCFAAYKCTCFDNFISKNICKHIHYIARLCNSKHDKSPYTGPLNNKKRNEANKDTLSLQCFPLTLTTTIEKFNSIAYKLQELKSEDKSMYEEIYQHLEAIDNLLSRNSASTSNEVYSVTLLTKSQVPVESQKRLKCD